MLHAIEILGNRRGASRSTELRTTPVAPDESRRTATYTQNAANVACSSAAPAKLPPRRPKRLYSKFPASHFPAVVKAIYSYLSATIGSTASARRPGCSTRHGNEAKQQRDDYNVTGSVASPRKADC